MKLLPSKSHVPAIVVAAVLGAILTAQAYKRPGVAWADFLMGR